MRRITPIVLLCLCICAGATSAGAEDEAIQFDKIRASESDFAAALAAHRRGDWKKAAALYEMAIQREPEFVEAMVNLARVLLERGEGGAATEWLDRAQGVRPDYPGTVSVRGTEALRSGRTQDAIEVLSRARHRAQNDPEVLINLGAALSESGLHAEAIAVLARATRAAPRDSAAAFNAALAYDRGGRSVEALHHYRKFLALSAEGDVDRQAVRDRIDRLT
ncbi:MAG: tetratricopeptide repeat protein, partial [Myxococcales bacterium]|nr:tetratricopeptide repeat protein [Myxococcales bacterium]